ncbi:unnamed protein product [Rhodiola kirilowii]
MLIISTLILILFTSPSHTTTSIFTSSPSPTPWPKKFHYSILILNSSASLQLADLYYDWPNGRLLNIMRDQLSDQLHYDLEWINGTSFLYNLDSNDAKYKTIHLRFPVGILPPDWLEGADFLGQERVDGFLCNVWEKVDFMLEKLCLECGKKMEVRLIWRSNLNVENTSK